LCTSFIRRLSAAFVTSSRLAWALGRTPNRDVPPLSAHDTSGIGVMAAATPLLIHIRKDSATAQLPVEMAASVKGSKPSPSDENNPLDITVLGLCSEAALEGVSCALLRYRQSRPNEPLRMSMLRVCAITASSEATELTTMPVRRNRCPSPVTDADSEPAARPSRKFERHGQRA
jgi:hypothetical protein